MAELDTPVVLVIFNRPALTEQAIEALRRVEPRLLLVIADGPRADKPLDAELCTQTRQVIETVDWQCEIVKNFADANMGAGRRVSSGLDWVFEQHETAIILEDDCVPDPTFFTFCVELLERYRDDERIMQVCGYNPLPYTASTTDSYFFSQVGSNWGWATWRRAWRYFDFSMQQWTDPAAQKLVRDSLADDAMFRRRQKINWATYRGKYDIWDFQWTFARMIQSGLSVMPAVNLVSNTGFGADATHYVDTDSPLATTRVQAMEFPLRHPIGVVPDREYDKRVDRLRHALSLRDYIRIAKNKLRKYAAR